MGRPTAEQLAKNPVKRGEKKKINIVESKTAKLYTGTKDNDEPSMKGKANRR